MNLWCLHGNLQLPSVWDLFMSCWHERDEALPVKLICPSLWEDDAADFKSWAIRFNAAVVRRPGDSLNWLMGYSLGGRLALHALLEAPDFWRGVIVIGAHPGYPSAEDRRDQLTRDRRWAARFRDSDDTWDQLLADWDALPVFCGRPNQTPRPESAFSRSRLADCFEIFSKGNQEFLTPALMKRERPPVLFVSGSEDRKYTEVGRELSRACPAVQHAVVPHAGHRVPWENPENFRKIIQVFLDATP